jgi:hypothetical protein
MQIHQGVKLVDFSESVIEELFGTSAASHYLSDYLQELSAKTILVEPHYVDRHYIDEFANYYSRSFHAPSAHCSRLHFFKAEKSVVSQSLIKAFAGSEQLVKSQQALQGYYKGFVVRRPLAGAPIGRTVLSTYPTDGNRRHYEVVRTYRINLLGMCLEVQGLAYQQQDRGAAVCASTALWSALQRIAFISGNRSPSPFAITSAAKSPFPASHGLHDQQMAEAISALGYSADRFDPDDNTLLFRAKLIACLDSQLPVVLGLCQKVPTKTGFQICGHAVTVTGYAEPNRVEEISMGNGVSILSLAGSLDTLYVHDDNLGFHAHYELLDGEEPNEDGNPVLRILRGRSSGRLRDWWKPDLWDIEWALIPKPDKMRLPLEDLFSNASMIQPLIERVFFRGASVYYRVRFDAGVSYQRGLVDMNLELPVLRKFLFSVSLPRHLAVISVFLADDATHLLDIVMDATSVSREPAILDVFIFVAPGVPPTSQAFASINAYTEPRSIPLIPGANQRL